MRVLILALLCARATAMEPAPAPAAQQQLAPVYLSITVTNGEQEEVHYIQLRYEEDLEAYHADEWDYETGL